MLSDKLLRHSVQIVQSVVVEVAVTGRKNITFAHLNRKFEQHFAKVFFKPTEHQLDNLTDDRRK